MTFMALVSFFTTAEDLPIPVDAVIGWIRNNTDHKVINLHAVGREKKAFRGACRRRAVSTLGGVYDPDYEIVTDIIYGDDLPEDWKRLVICKELLHVFDTPNERVNTPDAVTRLILSVITPELKASFLPAINDHLGAFRAMAVMLPRSARRKLQESVISGSRATTEVARFVRLPEPYVDLWLRIGDEIEPLLLGK